MGENLAIDGRMSVRSPMQWSSEPNGGFSVAAPERLRAPVTEGEYGPERVNAADQRHDPASLYSWLRTAISTRREHPELGWGAIQLLDVSTSVLAVRRDWDGRTVIALHNLAAEPCRVVVPVVDPEGTPAAEALVDLLDGHAEVPLDGDRTEVELDRYGHRWLAVSRAGIRTW